MSKKFFLQIPMPSKARFKVETGFINNESRWFIVERGTGAVVAHAGGFEEACQVMHDFEQRFPFPERMTQEQVDRMPPEERPTSTYRLLRWNALRARA